MFDLPFLPIDPRLAQQGPSFGQMLPPAAGVAPQMPPALPPVTPIDPNQLVFNPASPGGSFTDRLQRDPSLQMALLALGTGLLQPIKPGQSSLGHFGQALMGGAQAGIQTAELGRNAQMRERQTREMEERTRLEGRRTAVAEGELGERQATGAVQRTAARQSIEQNERMFPKTLQKIDQEINNLVSTGKLTEENAEFIKVRAREYPKEVSADLKRANAAQTSAEKLQPVETIFKETAKAMVSTGEAKSLEEAYSKLGQEWLGKGGGGGSGSRQVENRADIEKRIRAAHPQKPEETPEAYEQRVQQAVLQMDREQKSKGYFAAKIKYLENSLDRASDGILFDQYWRSQYGELPHSLPDQGVKGQPIPRDSSGKVNQKAMVDGMIYDYQTKDGRKGLGRWDARQKSLIPIESPSTSSPQPRR